MCRRSNPPASPLQIASRWGAFFSVARADVVLLSPAPYLSQHEDRQRVGFIDRRVSALASFDEERRDKRPSSSWCS